MPGLLRCNRQNLSRLSSAATMMLPMLRQILRLHAHLTAFFMGNAVLMRRFRDGAHRRLILRRQGFHRVGHGFLTFFLER